jgi:hypothetical protein
MNLAWAEAGAVLGGALVAILVSGLAGFLD